MGRPLNLRVTSEHCRRLSTARFLHLSRFLPVLLLASACGNDQLLQLKQEVASLREDLDELKRSQAASRVQFDEFRNRLILIEDKTDSERVARARKGGTGGDDRADWIPRLPTVQVSRAENAQHNQVNYNRNLPAEDPYAHVDARDRTDVPNALPRFSDAKPAQATNSQTIRLSRDAPLPGEEQAEAVEVSGPADDPPPQVSGTKPKLDPAATMYEKAKMLFDQGQIAEARRMFETLHRQYARHDLADNALYWIAEGYYAQAQWLIAAQSFLKVAKEYPRGNKVPDAMLKMALCYRKLGDDHGADDVLRQLVRLYPGTEPAEKAAALRKNTDGTP